jgi:adenosylcobinamide kinase/adenosylcobinamide-phosphate guanylyltransferase
MDPASGRQPTRPLDTVVRMPATRTLVTGPVRSGKSRVAEDLLSAETAVTYLAPGPVPDRAVDPDWADRIDAHRARRPAHWVTVETADLATGINRATGAVLIDCLGTWVTAVVDQLGTWDEPLARWQSRFDEHLEAMLDVWRQATGPLVAVTNEVGWSVVPEYRSGRTFRDLLGVVNQRVAAASDDVLLVVAGRVLRL